MAFSKPKSKSDTAEGIKDALQSKRPTVPQHLSLRDQDKPYWESILDARAWDTFYESDLENCVALAKAKADSDQLQHMLDVEGYVYTAPSGQLKPHPAESILDRKLKQIAALSRQLHINTTALCGRSEDTGNRTRIQRENREKYGGDSENDDLFASGDD